jgi:hypothetical protein
MAPELGFPESVGSNISPVADMNLRHIALINIHTHAPHSLIPQRYDWVR